MTKQPYFRRKWLAAVLAAAGMAGTVHAVNEVELNHPISSAQGLNVIGGSVTVNGVIGTLAGNPDADEDFYSFEGQEGDLVTLNIDGAEGGPGNLDTILTLYGLWPDYKPLTENDDALPDAGSIGAFDSRIEGFRLPASGRYYAGVKGWPGGYGSYSLTISGVTSPTPPTPPAPPAPPASSPLKISIEVKPGSSGRAPMQPKSKGNIPVALLSHDSFNALNVDLKSLTFGAKGDEKSLVRCLKGVEDVNRDGRPDLVCHFDNQLAQFSVGDDQALLKGVMNDGKAFEGSGWLKVVPTKNKKK